MKFRKPKHLGWIITGVLLLVFIVYSMIPKPTAVETKTIGKELLRQTVDAEGRTRYASKYTITLPATGTVSRIAIEPGDSVHAGQVVASYTPPVLDARQRAEAQAHAAAATESEKEVRETIRGLRPLLDQAERRAERTKRLFENGAIAKEQSENAADEASRLRQQLAASEARMSMASYEAQAARAAVAATPGQRVDIVSPISGVVLRRFEDQERLMMAGSPLLEIGDANRVEIVVDVLSTDAVRIKSGMHVLIEGWGGDDTLKGTVKIVEPAARIKVSSLGVEEKRVDIIVDVQSPPSSLGDGYKVDAQVVLWEGAGVVSIPLSALVRKDNAWYAFTVEDEKAVRRTITIGHRAVTSAEIRSGLQEGDVVVVHPPEALEDGARVVASQPTK